MRTFINILTQALVLLAIVIAVALGRAMRPWLAGIFLGVLGLGLAAVVGGMLTHLLVDTGRPFKRFGEA